MSAIKKVRAALIPRHKASAQLKYRFTNTTLDGLMVGAGVRYVGTIVDEQNYSGYKVPAYTLVDLVAQYDFADNWRAQLNVNNLTDKNILQVAIIIVTSVQSEVLQAQSATNSNPQNNRPHLKCGRFFRKLLIN